MGIMPEAIESRRWPTASLGGGISCTGVWDAPPAAFFSSAATTWRWRSRNYNQEVKRQETREYQPASSA